MTHKQIIAHVKRFETIAEAARSIGMTRRKLSSKYHKALDSLGVPDERETARTPEEQSQLDVQVHKLKLDKHTSDKKYRILVKEISQTQDQLKSAVSMSDAVGNVQINPIMKDPHDRKSQSTAVLLCGDWHLEEPVRPETIEYMNEYSLAIAEARAIKFFKNSLKLIEMSRSTTHINDLVLALLGDFITGYIHPELMEMNQLSPVQACAKAYEWICRGIDFLLEHGGFKRIVIPCCVGNHGRTTEKSRISTERENSFEWLLYHFIANRYASNPKIELQIAEGYLCYLDVYKTTLRIHHGHGIRYGGGVGGITVPLNKAIAKWNQFKPADIDILGHYHNRQSGKNYVVNGSLIGYAPYALSIKAEFEPPCQSFFLIHPEYGKTVEAPVFVG